MLFTLGVSDAPEKKHPWAKYYAERGVSRPPMAELVRVPTPKRAPTDPAVGAKKLPELSPELAAIVAEVTAMKPSATAAPFITAMQKEAVAREVRRRRVRRFARHGLVAVAAALALHLAITRWFHRAPSEEALAGYGQALIAEVLPLYSSVQQPLQIDRSTILPATKVDGEHLRYTAEVTLRLRQPLYAPASTNGSETYRRLQESLQIARAQEHKFKLFATAGAPEAPELPLLLQVSHRAGEAFVVRVPFVAKRTGWTWHLEPPQLDRRSVETPFTGAALAGYAETAHLIFGTAESRAEIRRRERLARDYIVAVTAEVQKRADVEAVAEPAPEVAAIEIPAVAAAPAIGPDDPALPATANQTAIDPDAPAIAPDAPAIEIPPEIAAPLKAAPPPRARRS